MQAAVDAAAVDHQAALEAAVKQAEARWREKEAELRRSCATGAKMAGGPLRRVPRACFGRIDWKHVRCKRLDGP
jgi:hypothetical protein